MRGKRFSKHCIGAALLYACQNAYSFSPETVADRSTILLQGATIITFNPESSSVDVLRNSSIPIKNDRIVSIGDDFNREDLAQAEIINVEGKVVTPGFVDAHHHLWQTAYRTTVSNISLIMQYTVRNGEFSPITLQKMLEEMEIKFVHGKASRQRSRFSLSPQKLPMRIRGRFVGVRLHFRIYVITYYVHSPAPSAYYNFKHPLNHPQIILSGKSPRLYHLLSNGMPGSCPRSSDISITLAAKPFFKYVPMVTLIPKKHLGTLPSPRSSVYTGMPIE